MESKRIAIITGASSGIGQEFAYQIDRFVKAGIDEIWLVARSKEKLEQCAKNLSHKAECFSIDLNCVEDWDELKYKLKAQKPCIAIAVLSAGYGIEGAFADIPLEEQAGMIDLNCKAVTRNIYDLIPYMRKNSRLILLASSAAFLPEIHFAVYAATKAYVLSLGRALNRELSTRGISVTTVCPGPVDTPFFQIAEKYQSGLFFKKWIMISPKKVVKQALIDAKDKKEVSVPGNVMKLFHLFSKICPHSVILSICQFFGK